MRRRPHRTLARSTQPAVERVEARVLLATFMVTNTNDDTFAGSLRAAISASNAASPGPNLIDFAIPGNGVQTINITSALPPVTVPVTIDGTSQPGYTSTPLVDLKGTGTGASFDGLDIAAGASTVQGLAINQFTGEGISLSVAGGDAITEDFIGTDPTGTIAQGNHLDGVLVQVNSNNNTISGDVISGNTNDGISLNGQLFGRINPATSGDLIVGNKIGTDVNGGTVLKNGRDGVQVQNAMTATIGGTTAAARNIITGNGSGVELDDNSDGTVVEGNYIGTDVTGSVALGNGAGGAVLGDGVALRGISNSTIGGTVPGAGNLISGNNGYGINSFVIGSTSNAIQGNLIGTDVSGTRALGNLSGGVFIFGPLNVTIGGTVAGARNIISANGKGPLGGDGIGSFGTGTGLLIQGNFIGTDITGTIPLGNGGDGIDATVAGVTVGGIIAGAGNLIAYNGVNAVFNHDGVGVTQANIPVLNNSIHDNANLGINVGSLSTSQPAPVLTSAASAGLTSTVLGSLTAPDGVYTLQFFSTPTLNASGNAEGETLIGTQTVTVVGGTTSFNDTLPSGFDPGSLITATATTIAGGTSRFSTGIVGTGSANGIKPPTITGTGSSGSVAAGGQETDTFTITNSGAGPDLGVTFSDVIPANTTFVSGMTSSGAPVIVVNGEATAVIGALAAGGSVTVTIVLGTSIATEPSFTNVAEVVSTTPNVFAGTETASITTVVANSADLAVTIFGPAGPTLVGQDLTYVVTVTNNGPADSSGFLLADQLPDPAGFTFVSATPSSGPAPVPMNGVLIVNFGALAIGASYTLDIVVRADTTGVPSATDVAAVAGIEADPNQANNRASFTSEVDPLADVSVAIIPSSTSVDIGGTLVYLVTVTNNGPSTATGLIFHDSLPADATFVSALTQDGRALTDSGAMLSDVIATLAAGQSFSYTITVVPISAPASIVDVAAALAIQADNNLANNTAMVTTNVAPIADLAITSQTVSPNPAIEGTLVMITIGVTDGGPSTATGVVITQKLPAGLTFVSGTADGGAVTVSGGVVTAPVGDLIDGASSVVQIVALITASGSITLTSAASSATIDPNLGNNTASTTFQVLASADLSVTLSGPAGPSYSGNLAAYTAVVTNLGPSTATNILLSEPLFAGADFEMIESNGVAGLLLYGSVAVASIGSLAPGASATVVLIILPTGPGVATESASVASDTPDPNPANNFASVATDFLAPTSVIAFSTSGYAVTENAGYAAITFNRSGYLGNDASVVFTTVAIGSATPNVDYIPIVQGVDFPAGVSTATVLVPVLDNPYDNHNEILDLLIEDPLGGALLSPDPSVATLTIVDIDPVLVGPTVTAVKLTGPVNSITSIELDTTGFLNPTTADNPSNYTLTALGGGGKSGLPFGTVVPVSQAIYNPATSAIYLVLSRPLPANELFLVDVNGSSPSAVTDLAGNPLNSVLGGQPGSNYDLTVARGTAITYTDENDVPVTLSLTGPGTIDIDRYVSGQVNILQVVGGVTGKTVITGTVHPTTKRSTFGSILGLGAFGEIRARITTPPFYVTTPVFPNINTVDGPSTDTLLPPPPTPPKPTKPTKTKTVKVKAAEVSSHEHHPAPKVHEAKTHHR